MSAMIAGLSSGWRGSCPARYMAPVCSRPARVKIGSIPALVSMLSPVRVASSPAENATMAAGSGRPASRAARQVVTARPPPAESPANTIVAGSTPPSTSALYALSVSSTPAGNGCSGASR
jgi:hypothetical protein